MYRLSSAAGAAVFAYDVLIHLDVELQYIWVATANPRQQPNKRATMMFNLLYLVQRYIPLLGQIILPHSIMGTNSGVCTFALTLSSWCAFVGLLLSELMLSLRTWAVWGRKPLMAVIYVAVTLGCTIIAVVFIGRFIKGVDNPSDPELHAPHRSGDQNCSGYLTTNSSIYAKVWILVVIYDTDQSGGSSKLAIVVYRDGLIYYGIIFRDRSSGGTTTRAELTTVNTEISFAVHTFQSDGEPEVWRDEGALEEGRSRG
ncbi:hypothetical protein L218DRAFT_947689 [Marasmius fiardii PR-910]|nr:hypothetical protein L218DRAFT_947689 [Marasmius fiardii PR-910]